MLPRLLADTHVVIRWLIEARKLSREQMRTLAAAERRAEFVAVSAMSLLEIAVLTNDRKLRAPASELLQDLQTHSLFRILPITFEIALEVAFLGPALRDPADRAIVATARVHRLRLVTSDQRIIESKLVPVVD